MYDYFFRLRARLEYLDGLKWYGERSRQAAEDFVASVTGKLHEICLRPTQFRNTNKHYREAILEKFPFSIVYRIDKAENLIVVLSIFHHSRNPRDKFKQ